MSYTNKETCFLLKHVLLHDREFHVLYDMLYAHADCSRILDCIHIYSYMYIGGKSSFACTIIYIQIYSQV